MLLTFDSRSSIFYNTSARHESDTSHTSATTVLRKWNKCNTSKKFDFDKDTSENIFPHSYVSYIAMKNCKERSNFILKNYLLEKPRSHTKMHLESKPQSLDL